MVAKTGLKIPDGNFQGGGGSAAKLVKGGAEWTWNFSTKELSFTSDAFIQVPGLQDGRNTIPTSASPITLTNATDVAYVTLNEEEGANANLSISVDDINNEANVNGDVYIIIRRVGDDLVVGHNLIKDGQTKQLDVGMTWADPVDVNILPNSDNTRDLGEDVAEFKDIYTHQIKHGDAVDSDLSISTISDNGNIIIDPHGSGEVSVSGNINLNNNQITTMADGTSSDHGINKGQLDTEVTTINNALDTKATRELDNLRNTAVNDHIIPDTNNARDLGSDALEYKDVYAHQIKHGDVSNPDLVISTTSASGNISVEPNSTGAIILKDLSVGHIGHVWTESGLEGQGNWDLASDTFQVWEDIKADFDRAPYNYLLLSL